MRPSLLPLLLATSLTAGCGDDGPAPADAAVPPDLTLAPDLAPRPLAFSDPKTAAAGMPIARPGYPTIQPLAAGDFDGDKLLDVAVPATEAVSLVVLLGDGKGGFTMLPTIPTKGRATSLVAADLDGDGQDELVAGYDGNKLSLVHGRRNRIFDAPVDIDWIDNTYVSAAGDFNGDGKADLITGPLAGKGLTYGFSDGKGGLIPLPAYVFAGPAVILSVGDLDGDKRADLALSESFEFLDVLSGRGESLILDRQIDVPGATVDAAVMADLDGDGKSDIVYTSSADGVHVQPGSGTKGAAVPMPQGHADAARAADLDGDGHLDVVMTRDRANEVVVLRGDGKGALSLAPVKLVTDGPAMGLAVRDFDGDGQPDIAVTQGAGGVRLWLNATR